MLAAADRITGSSRIARLLRAAHDCMTSPEGLRSARFVFDPEQFLSKEEIRIASYRQTAGLPMLPRRALAFQAICRQWSTPIYADELVVGSQRGNIARGPMSPEQQNRHAAISAGYTDLGIAFGEGHVVCDYEAVLQRGLRGQAERLEDFLSTAASTDPRRPQWEAMLVTCQAARDYATRYAEAAHSAARAAEDPAEAARLEQIAAHCTQVPWEPARTFAQALQSFWLLHLLLHVESPAVAISPGRMDQYLWPFYAADLAAGRLTPSEAAEALACLWLKLWEGDESQNVTLGGVDAHGTDVTNELSLLMLRLTGELRAFQPSISVRIGPGSPEQLVAEALRLSSLGLGQPSFFADETVTAGLIEIGVPLPEARDWAIVGCYEAVVAGAEWGRTVAGGVNLPEVVLQALAEEPRSFAALLQGTREHLSRAIDRSVEAANAHERHEAENAPSPFQSVLMRDCIQRGKDIYRGGARHNHSACWIAGLATAVDGLVAVKHAVYEEGRLTVPELLALLEADLAGHEDQRQLLLKGAPKFGNDEPEVDALAAELCGCFCDELATRRNGRGGRIKPSLAMYQQHLMGRQMGATADGRHAGAALSAGVAPTQGRNVRGVTATLASCASLPHHRAANGNFLILCFSPEHIAGARGQERLGQLIATYFGAGGSHVMVNVVDAETLRDAQVHPERHGDLMVRLSGLSAYFVTLDRDTQENIVARSAQGL